MPTQLAPFNAEQFDKCMLWLSHEHGKGLTQYHMVKLHVLTDFFHVLAYGKPVIGGELQRWPEGPVVKPAYNRARARVYQYNSGKQCDLFEIEQTGENTYSFTARPECVPSRDDFSESELDAMSKAWEVLMVQNASWPQSKAYFHDADRSFFGKAYDLAARAGSKRIDWNALLDCYDEQQGEDHSYLKTLFATGV